MSLAAAGAFQCWGLPARQALWKIQSLHLDPESLMFGRERESFADLSPEVQEESDGLPEETSWQRMRREYNWQGYSLARHPLKILRPALQAWSDYDRSRGGVGFFLASSLEETRHQSYIRVAGLLGVYQRPPTAKGFAFLTLEDETGFFNIVMPPQVYQEYRLVIAHHPLMEVRGRLEKQQGVINIKAEKLHPLPLQNLLHFLEK